MRERVVVRSSFEEVELLKDYVVWGKESGQGGGSVVADGDHFEGIAPLGRIHVLTPWNCVGQRMTAYLQVCKLHHVVSMLLVLR
jgi:hypothetical protein